MSIDVTVSAKPLNLIILGLYRDRVFPSCQKFSFLVLLNDCVRLNEKVLTE